MGNILKSLTETSTNKDIENFFNGLDMKNIFHFFSTANMPVVKKFAENKPEKFDDILSKKDKHNKSFIDYFINNIPQLTKEESPPIFIHPLLWRAINRNITNEHSYILHEERYIFNYDEQYYLSKISNLKFDIDIDYDNLGRYNSHQIANIFETNHLFKNQAGNNYMAIFAIHSLFYQFREHRDYEKSHTEYSLFINELSESNKFFDPDIFHENILNIKSTLINNNQHFLDFFKLGYYEHEQQSRETMLNSIFKVSDVYMEKQQLNSIIDTCSLHTSLNKKNRI